MQKAEDAALRCCLYSVRGGRQEKPTATHRMVLLHDAPHLLPHLRGCFGIYLPQLHYHFVYVAFCGLQQIFHGGPEIIRFG